MRSTRQAVLRPFKILRKKARAWKNDTPQGRHVAKRCARYLRRSKQFFLLTLGNGSQAGRQAVAGHESLTTQTQNQLSTNGDTLQEPTTDSAAVAANDSSMLVSKVDSKTVLNSIKYFANPGPGFEKPSGIDSRQLSQRARTVAFYLPQFHPFSENDNWWGDGFSEWRNVARGAPRFDGHYQPRIPRDLGFYDLNSIETIRAQSEMATSFGIESFCFYYYWFNGKRLMDMPLDKFINDDQIKQDYCIMWANENWTRTWDGHDKEVLIQQDYLESDEDAFIADTSRYMAHERYMQVNGRPLFILYRPGLLPNAKATLQRWRELWTDTLGVTPWILMVQGFGDLDPREYGLDGALEFPPHKVAINVPDMNQELTLFDPDFAGHVRSYDGIINESLNEVPSSFPLIKTVSPHWDNDARREGRGMVLQGSTPERYEYWLNGVIDHARKNPFNDEPIVFVNAWNEWAESAYLEPDVHYGHAYLNATQRAVHGLSELIKQAPERNANNSPNKRILLVGHDAHKHGAQMLLLSLATLFNEQFGMDVTVLIKNGGVLVDSYQKVADTHVLSEIGTEGLNKILASRSFEVSICNTCVTGDLVPVLKEAGLRVVSLVHEMPMLIEEYSLQKNVELINENADHVIFPSDIVRQGFTRFSRAQAGEHHIKPQGTYMQIDFSQSARERIRSELGLGAEDKMVLNVGYADLRKGFDLFLQTAERWMKIRKDVHFVWAGAISGDMKRWVQSDLQHSAFASRIHLIGFTSEMSDYYSACDALFLTSREDPYPTVVLEAMNVGVPTVLFKGATGFDAVMQEHGFSVDRGDRQALEAALTKALDADSEQQRNARIAYVEGECQLDDYSFELLQLLRPELNKISVVVPNYNYENYLPSRLASIFNQDVPIFETIVLDDMSTDNSLEIIKQSAKIAGRKIRLVANKVNSGNVFQQWKLGSSLSSGSHIWIAEADDLAKPEFLSRSLASFKNDTCFSFCDSEQVDGNDALLASSYGYYYKQVDGKLFDKSFVMDGRDFVSRALSVRNVILNVSSVVWDRQHLSDTLHSLGKELTDYSLVGDWRLYLASLDNPNCSVAYVGDSLNVHRRHASSVTHALDLQHHLNEILAIHSCALEIVDRAEIRLSQSEYELELRKQFMLPAANVQAA
ncbi:MAG: glycosyltransferase involved in cell wall biosynthesis [Granulosicoccus sp.]|jgi:glycosyltransferase involved in cell wall biosynthesis